MLDDERMLTALVDWWRSFSTLAQVGIVAASLTAVVVVLILRLLMHAVVADWIEDRDIPRVWPLFWLGILLGVNWIWGVPGLLIAIGFIGGLAVVHLVQKADKADMRRKTRLYFAARDYLQDRFHRYRDEHLRTEKTEGMDFYKWLELNHEVKNEEALSQDWDLLGVTPEDVHQRIESAQRKDDELDAIVARQSSETSGKS